MAHDNIAPNFAYTSDRPIAPYLRERLRSFVETRGLLSASKALGVGRETLARCIGALPVKSGTAQQLPGRLDAALGYRPLDADELLALRERINANGAVKTARALGLDQSELWGAAAGHAISPAAQKRIRGEVSPTPR